MASNPDIRWKQRLQSFGKAFGQLSAATTLAQQRELSELEQQGLIHIFEFTHELAWNALKDFLEARSAGNLYGTREAFKQGLIEHGETWVDMLAARNKSSHTYNEKTANEEADAIASSFVQEFAAFQAKFAALAQQESS